MKKSFLYLGIVAVFFLVMPLFGNDMHYDPIFLSIAGAGLLAGFLLLVGRDLFFKWLNHPTPFSGFKNWAFISISTTGLIVLGVMTVMGKIPYYLWLLFTILFFPDDKKA